MELEEYKPYLIGCPYKSTESNYKNFVTILKRHGIVSKYKAGVFYVKVLDSKYSSLRKELDRTFTFNFFITSVKEDGFLFKLKEMK